MGRVGRPVVEVAWYDRLVQAGSGPDGAVYRDRWIVCGPDRIEVRGYYFPWGTKRIPYASIKDVRRVKIGVLAGMGRIWGTANPRYWAHLDPKRPSKDEALILDVGRRVSPFLTPDDTDAAESAIRRLAGLAPPGAGAERGPLI